MSAANELFQHDRIVVLHSTSIKRSKNEISVCQQVREKRHAQDYIPTGPSSMLGWVHAVCAVLSFGLKLRIYRLPAIK